MGALRVLARPGETLGEVNSFSAYATWLPDAHQRHIEYVKAIEHAGVKCIMGHFKNKPVKCNKCSQTWVHHEEKETDVHIAARIVADAFKGRFDRAILITADSDLAPAVKIVKAAFPMKQILVVAPPGRFGHARDLNPALQLTKGRLAKCLLPTTEANPAGKVLFTRPLKILSTSGLLSVSELPVSGIIDLCACYAAFRNGRDVFHRIAQALAHSAHHL